MFALLTVMFVERGWFVAAGTAVASWPGFSADPMNGLAVSPLGWALSVAIASLVVAKNLSAAD